MDVHRLLCVGLLHVHLLLLVNVCLHTCSGCRCLSMVYRWWQCRQTVRLCGWLSLKKGCCFRFGHVFIVLSRLVFQAWLLGWSELEDLVFW